MDLENNQYDTNTSSGKIDKCIHTEAGSFQSVVLPDAVTLQLSSKEAAPVSSNSPSSQTQTLTVESKNADTELLTSYSGCAHEYQEQTDKDYMIPESSQVSEVDYTQTPKLIAKSDKEFRHRENFLKGCKWSSDGSYLLTNSEDHILRVFSIPSQVLAESYSSIPELQVVLRVREPEIIYDFCWLDDTSTLSQCSLVDDTNDDLRTPSFTSDRYILSSSKEQPVHLFRISSDDYSIQTAATYKAYNNVDEPVSAHSVCVCQRENFMYCGYVKCIRLFDLNRAGRNIAEWPTYDRTSRVGQKGIISCIDYDVNFNCYAAGSYDKTVAVYAAGGKDCLGVLQGHKGGVTNVKFTSDGVYLYSGTRMDSEILCWDMRKLGNVVFCTQRSVTTNQRYSFDLMDSDQYLVSGHTSGEVSVWRTLHHPQHETSNQYSSTPPYIKPAITFQPHVDACTSISVHPNNKLLATGSGQRHFITNDAISSSSSDNEDSDTNDPVSIKSNTKPTHQHMPYTDNSIRIWSFSKN